MTKRIYWSFLTLLVFAAYFLISLPDYSGDVKNHVAWGEGLLEHGSYGFFERTFPGFSYPTYPPFVVALFGLSFLVYQLVLSLVLFLNNLISFFPSYLVPFLLWENTEIAFLKLPGIIATLGTAFLMVRFGSLYKEELEYKNKYLGAILLLLNPAVIYISSIWGQTDLLQNLLLLLAFYLLFRKRFWLSAILAGLALLSKQTILIFFGIYLLTTFKLFGLRKFIEIILITVTVFYLAYLPFYGFSFDKPAIHYFNSIRLVDFGVSENALNLWGALFNFGSASSNQFFLFVSFDAWGYLMFLSMAIPLSLKFYFKRFNYQLFFHYLFLISIIYFLVFTRMHERYLIPAVILSCFLAPFSKKYWVNIIFFSAMHSLNLYRGLFVPDIPYLKVLAVSVLFLKLTVLAYLLVLIYNLYLFFRLRSK